jgi:hypothetical protein
MPQQPPNTVAPIRRQRRQCSTKSAGESGSKIQFGIWNRPTSG